jgi:hypothetical protein
VSEFRGQFNTVGSICLHSYARNPQAQVPVQEQLLVPKHTDGRSTPALLLKCRPHPQSYRREFSEMRRDKRDKRDKRAKLTSFIAKNQQLGPNKNVSHAFRRCDNLRWPMISGVKTGSFRRRKGSSCRFECQFEVNPPPPASAPANAVLICLLVGALVALVVNLLPAVYRDTSTRHSLHYLSYIAKRCRVPSIRRIPPPLTILPAPSLHPKPRRW